jgi:hypothetical protein
MLSLFDGDVFIGQKLRRIKNEDFKTLIGVCCFIEIVNTSRFRRIKKFHLLDIDSIYIYIYILKT